MDEAAMMLAIKDILFTSKSKSLDNERTQEFITALMNCPVNMTLDLRNLFKAISSGKDDGKPDEDASCITDTTKPRLKRQCTNFSGSMYIEDWNAITDIIAEIKRDTKKIVTRMAVYRAIIEVGIQHKDELEIDLG